MKKIIILVLISSTLLSAQSRSDSLFGFVVYKQEITPVTQEIEIPIGNKMIKKTCVFLPMYLLYIYVPNWEEEMGYKEKEAPLFVVPVVPDVYHNTEIGFVFKNFMKPSK